MQPAIETYSARTFNLAGLQGISDKTLEVHFGLYQGYVKNVNLLNEELADLTAQKRASAADPQFAELTRRLGFEYNGMVLHEDYFENMTTKRSDGPDAALRQSLGGSLGYDAWRADFAAVGGLRGVGWAIAYLDPRTARVTNHWITLHEVGNVAGFVPLVVMDVWEHAYLLDYKPADRSKYIEAFFANVDWSIVGRRLQAASG